MHPRELLALEVVVVPALEMMKPRTRSPRSQRATRDHQRRRHVTDEDYHQR